MANCGPFIKILQYDLNFTIAYSLPYEFEHMKFYMSVFALLSPWLEPELFWTKTRRVASYVTP